MEPTKKQSKFKSPSANKGQPAPKLSIETLGIKSVKQTPSSSWVNPLNSFSKRKNEIDEKQIKHQEKQELKKDDVVSYYSQTQSQDAGTTAAFNSIINNLIITLDGQNESEQSDEDFSFINIVPPSPSTQKEQTEDQILSDEEEDEEDEEELSEDEEQDEQEEQQRDRLKARNKTQVDAIFYKVGNHHKRQAHPIASEGLPAKKHFGQKQASKFVKQSNQAKKDSRILFATKDEAPLQITDSKQKESQRKGKEDSSINRNTSDQMNNLQSITSTSCSKVAHHLKEKEKIPQKYEQKKAQVSQKNVFTHQSLNFASSSNASPITTSQFPSVRADLINHPNNQINSLPSKLKNFNRFDSQSANQLIASLQNLTISNSITTQDNQQQLENISQGSNLNVQQYSNNILIDQSGPSSVQNQQQLTIDAISCLPSHQNKVMISQTEKDPSSKAQREHHRQELMNFMKQWNIKSAADCEEVMVDILSKMSVQRAKQWLYHHHEELEAMASTLMIIAIKEIGQIHGVKHGSCDAQVQAIDTEQLMKQYATFAQMLKKQKEPNELTGFKEGSEVLKNTMQYLFEKAKRKMTENLDDLIEMGLDQKVNELNQEFNEIMVDSSNLNHLYFLDQIRRYNELQEIERQQKELRELLDQIEAKLDERDHRKRDHILVTHINRCQETTNRVKKLEEHIKILEKEGKRPKSCMSKSQMIKRFNFIKEKIVEAEENTSKMRAFLKNHGQK